MNVMVLNRGISDAHQTRLDSNETLKTLFGRKKSDAGSRRQCRIYSGFEQDSAHV